MSHGLDFLNTLGSEMQRRPIAPKMQTRLRPNFGCVDLKSDVLSKKCLFSLRRERTREC